LRRTAHSAPRMLLKTARPPGDRRAPVIWSAAVLHDSNAHAGPSSASGAALSSTLVSSSVRTSSATSLPDQRSAIAGGTCASISLERLEPLDIVELRGRLGWSSVSRAVSCVHVCVRPNDAERRAVSDVSPPVEGGGSLVLWGASCRASPPRSRLPPIFAEPSHPTLCRCWLFS